MTCCTICLDGNAIMHWHHTIPRSRGGDASLQIPLCPDCHNTLHAYALAVVSRLRSTKAKKKPLRRFWKTTEQEERASPYLEILVKALMSPPIGDRQHLLSISVPTQLFEEFKLLQLELGMSSQEATLVYCLEYMLQSKGLKNAVLTQSTSCVADDLWFLPVPSK